jgi:hypothetical protein
VKLTNNAIVVECVHVSNGRSRTVGGGFSLIRHNDSLLVDLLQANQ